MTVLAGAKIKIFSFAIRSPFKILQQHTSLLVLRTCNKEAYRQFVGLHSVSYRVYQKY